MVIRMVFNMVIRAETDRNEEAEEQDKLLEISYSCANRGDYVSVITRIVTSCGARTDQLPCAAK